MPWIRAENVAKLWAREDRLESLEVRAFPRHGWPYRLELSGEYPDGTVLRFRVDETELRTILAAILEHEKLTDIRAPADEAERLFPNTKGKTRLMSTDKPKPIKGKAKPAIKGKR